MRNSKSLLIFKEKHDDVHYLVETREDRYKVAYTVLKERYNSGYMYPDVEQINSNFEYDVSSLKERTNSAVFILDTESEAFVNSPDVMKEKVLKDKENYEKAYKRLEQERDYDLKFVSELERILSLDPEDAIKDTFTNSRGREFSTVWALLQERDDAEYERFMEVRLHSTPDFYKKEDEANADDA